MAVDSKTTEVRAYVLRKSKVVLIALDGKVIASVPIEYETPKQTFFDRVKQYLSRV